MDALVCEAARLIESAQTGQADAVRRTVEARLVELSGSIEAGPSALHFARVVAFRATGDHRAALAACNLMLAAAEREATTASVPPHCRCVRSSASRSVTATWASTTPRRRCVTSSPRKV